MKKIILLIVVVMFLVGCASSTTIRTLPEGVKVVESGGNIVGITPYWHWDRDVSDSTRTFTLEKDGYKSKQITIKKDCLYIHRFFTPPVLALPWLMGYQNDYIFEMVK